MHKGTKRYTQKQAKVVYLLKIPLEFSENIHIECIGIFLNGRRVEPQGTQSISPVLTAFGDGPPIFANIKVCEL